MQIDGPAVLQDALWAVRNAGDIILHAWDKPKNIKHKGRIDLVTETDLAVEEFLKEHLSNALPESTFLAEETASDFELGDLTWVIDPVDGTTNFAHGFPFVGTSVGLWMEGRMVLGIINVPKMGETFWALRGNGAFLNGRPIRVSTEDTLEGSLIATGFPYGIQEKVDEITDNLTKMLVSTQGVRRPGAAAVDLAYVACGRCDGFYEADLNPWDTAAGWLLIEEAGGKVTTYDGGEYKLGERTILASNGPLHGAMSELLIS